MPVEEQVRRAGQLAVAVVSSGFVARPDAEQHLVELVADDPETFPDLDARRTRQIVAQVWRERLAIESTWTDEGDYPAVRDAFDDLERAGVVARMSFTCCQTCGQEQINDEATPQARGYTFFHSQDADRLAPVTSELYLAFGSFTADDPGHDPRDTRDTRIGAEVVQTLSAHGLAVDWDGHPGTRIRLPRLDWRKQLPAG